MEGSAEKELERRSKFLNSLILQQKKKNGHNNSNYAVAEQQQPQQQQQQRQKNDGKVKNMIRVRASDMPSPLQNHAFATARNVIDSMPSSSKLDSKRLALSLKKDFDSTYGPAWHCIVGTSFGSYVTHSLGGFLYFSIDNKVYVLLFKTAVEPLGQS